VVKRLKNPEDFRGLTEKEVEISREKNGSNVINAGKGRFSELGKKIVQDPMLLLLVAAGVIYFVTGNSGDAWFMFAAIIAIVSISLYQDRRSQKALDALRVLTLPNCRVIRNGIITSIRISDVVIGDYLLAEEGSTIAADGTIQRSNDFAVNESILTGESLPVEKTIDEGINEVYQGTVVTRGLAICKVTAIGAGTKLGQIGQNLAAIEETETPLQKQIASFVRRMAIIGSAFFFVVWSINFYRSHNILDSLLKALSLAMSILPEEIPVAFITFMAIGAWRLSKLGVIVKHINTIETLGSATVICVDKTGTITKNQMDLRDLYVFATDSIDKPASDNSKTRQLINYAMWASEPIPFDPMEVALHEAYRYITEKDERHEYKMIHEYPLSGHPPFMTHIFQRDGTRIIAAKGAPEGILSVCKLNDKDIARVTDIIRKISSTGARVLGVARGHWHGSEFPETQDEISFTFLGLVSFYDPPKDNMRQVLSGFYNAGINVKMITGDYTETAESIANQIGLTGARLLTGEEVMKMTEQELQYEVERVNIFARTFPEAKLKVLEALKKNGHVVAMTGDGVNDGPALKAAHIGVAMGKRGTEVAKQASAMILATDDLSRMVDAVAAGRKIYTNLKKAIQYIISIHIPIILMVVIPLMLNWTYAFMFTPVHVIFLELIMGPTCSIVYENEPGEKGLMQQKPRPATLSFFNWQELTTSIVQGLAISFGALAVYQYSIYSDLGEQLTRALVFTTLISANIFLTLVNRSLVNPFWISIKYRNPLVPITIGVTAGLTALILFVRPVSDFFRVISPSPFQLFIAGAAGFISVVWIDVLKVIRLRSRQLILLLVACFLVAGAFAQAFDPGLRTAVQQTQDPQLQKFYEANNYSRAWTNPTDVNELLGSIQSIYMDGLNPEDYNIGYLSTLSVQRPVAEEEKTRLDLELTRSFLRLAHDLYEGKINPDKLFPGDWEACTTSADYAGLLQSALNGNGIGETLEFMKPMDNSYEGLKYMLSNFRVMESKGCLPGIKAGNAIHPGDADERIADIRKTLALLRLMPAELDNGDIRYDSTILIAVTKFQRLHGLTPDGEIGRKTQQALQLTASDYIKTIVANLEKYRWHQSRLLERSIKINIPSFGFKLSDHERTELEMKVIIGRVDRPTPVVSSVITAMIINPTWTVPPTILEEDLLPTVISDPGYLRRHNMRVITSRGKELNPDSINWSKFASRKFPYNIQQDPGPTNPLGRIKFIFPNHHAVYLHDTNMPSLFASQQRSISSGCIRIESPMALVRVLTPASGWTDEMVRAEIDVGETRVITVKDPLPIHLTYFTAYVEGDELHMVNDLYGYDSVILQALKGASRNGLR
jgi:Ca2+-transporting ATPase